MRKILVLFDIDGTLVELWDVHIKAYAKVFERVYGLPNINFRGKYTPGKTNEDTVRDVLGYLGHSDEFIEKGITKVMPLLKKLYPKLMREGKVNVLPGVKELLEALRKNNVPMGIVTGNRLSVSDLIIRKAGLDNYFLFKATPDDSMDRRSRLEAAVKKAEVITKEKYPAGTVYFVDDSHGSIPISKELGIKSVAVATGEISYEKLLAAKPDYLLGDLRNTEDVLKVILG